MNKELEALLQAIDPKSRETVRQLFNEMIEGGKNARQAIADLNAQFNTSYVSLQDMAGSISGMLTALGDTNRATNEAKKSYRNLNSVVRKLQDDQAGIYNLSLKELRALRDKGKSEINRLRTLGQIHTENREIQAANASLLENERSIVEAVEKRIEYEREINSRMGISNTLATVLEKSLNAAGISGSQLGESLRDARIEMRQMAVDGYGPLAIAFSSLSKLAPAIVIGLAVSGFNELNKASVEFQRLTGDSISVADSFNSRLATSAQLLQQAGQLTERFGINALAAFSTDVLAGAAELQNRLGLTVEQAGQFALISRLSESSTDNVTGNIVRQVNTFNRLNRTAISHGLILRDIASTSEEILVSLGNQPKALANAATAARRLGLTLNEVDGIANSLLQFESSIENELTAQLITGRDINLAKARELALTNDLAGLSSELFKNSASIADFSRMTRVEQQSLATALGLSRQQLGRIALQRGLELGLTNKALEAAAGVTAEDLKRTEALESIRLSLQKIAQAFAGPLEALARFLDTSLGIKAVIGATAVIAGGLLLSSVVNIVNSFRRLVGYSTAFARNMTTSAVASQAVATNAMRTTPGGGGLLFDPRTGRYRNTTTGRFVGSSAARSGARIGASAVGGAGLRSLGSTLLRFIPYIGLAIGGFMLLKGLVDREKRAKSKPQLAEGGIVTRRTEAVVGEAGPEAVIPLNRFYAKMDELIDVVKAGGTVQLDGYKVGEALTLGTYNNS